MYYYLMKKTVIIYMFYLFFISNSFIIKKPRLYINTNDPKQFNEIKHITITPGGIGGLYSLGVSCFIKDNYDLNTYSYLGASAGAWISLVSAYKGNTTQMIFKLLKSHNLNHIESVNNLQYLFKDYILNHYDINDFNVEKINICISEVTPFSIQPKVINNFIKLEELIDCCIVSSHIPYVTSNQFIKTYNNKITFDGGFTPFPPNDFYHHIMITPNMYNSESLGSLILSLFKRDITKNSLLELFKKGYNDAMNHKKELDIIFIPEYGYLNVHDNDFEIIYQRNLYLDSM
jgi:hypothetical protein